MEMQRCIMSDEDLAVRMAKESSPAHLNRQRVRFSSIALSWERREKKKRCWRSDRDSLSLGTDKLNVCIIAQKYHLISNSRKTKMTNSIYKQWIFCHYIGTLDFKQ